MTPRMKEHYQNEVRPKLTEHFSYKNPMQVPRFEKIVVNMGIGDAVKEQKALDSAVSELQTITGQRPLIRRAKKSIANFKLRAGMPIGAAVTLRGDRMFEFFDRFVNVAIPRIRDFRGLPDKSFDGNGNYAVGVTEQIIFPEIDYDKVFKVRGLNVCIVTSAKTDEECREMLRLMNMPFRR